MWDETDGSQDRAPPLDDERLLVDVDGFEGPLDLLLELARRQKVDLHQISVLALAEQYLAFVEAARKVRLELAADYLVMAAWLAFLKSKLLLPAAPSQDEPDAGELAAALAERLRRLDIIRAAARALEARPQLGRDMRLRGTPQTLARDCPETRWSASIYDLIAAYARERQSHASQRIALARRMAWSLAEAREALLGDRCGTEWDLLEEVLAPFLRDTARNKNVRATAISVALELVREGRISLRQDAIFAPLWIRSRADSGRTGGAPA